MSIRGLLSILVTILGVVLPVAVVYLRTGPEGNIAMGLWLVGTMAVSYGAAIAAIRLRRPDAASSDLLSRVATIAHEFRRSESEDEAQRVQH